MSRQLMIPTADTQLYTVDTPGGSPPLLFLSGGFGTVQNWNRVIRASRGRNRGRFDRGRAGSPVHQPTTPCRQRSTTSDASSRRPASNARSWSGGPTAPRSRCATRHIAPEQVGGLVLIDGAYPIAMFDEAGKEKVRAQFRRLGWIMRILAAVGRSARMSPCRIGGRRDRDGCGQRRARPDFAALECPTVFVVGTGGHSGATEEEMRTVRAAVAEAEASNPACPSSRRRPTSTHRSSPRPPTQWSPRSRMSSASLRD